jgi:hypothetical protein
VVGVSGAYPCGHAGIVQRVAEASVLTAPLVITLSNGALATSKSPQLGLDLRKCGQNN